MRGVMEQKKNWLAVGSVLTCVALGGAVSATSGEDPVPDPGPEAAGAQAAPVGGIASEQSARIGEFRRSRSSDDALPKEWSDKITEGGDQARSFGANPSLSRRVGPGVWLLPGKGFVCVVNTTPSDGGLGLGCASPQDVDRGLLAPADLNADGEGILTGVVPDGVGSVTLIDRDRSRRSVEVARNTYRAPIDANIAEVRFTGPDGAERVLPMAWER